MALEYIHNTITWIQTWNVCGVLNSKQRLPSQCSITAGSNNYHTKTIKSKQAGHKCDVERFNLGKQSELEVRKQYQIEITNSFATLENLNDSKGINRAWKKTSQGIWKPQLKSFQVCTNCSSMNHGVMKNVHHF